LNYFYYYNNKPDTYLSRIDVKVVLFFFQHKLIYDS
jgi:hypothetical protein